MKLLSVDISVGGRRDGQGRGNSLFVAQGGGCGCIDLGRGHSATLYQFGTLSDLFVVQQNNQSSSAISATNPSGDQFGSVADISQSAFGSSIQLFQTGTNYASISQGGASADLGDPAAGLGPGNAGTSGNNTLVVQQIDAGATGSRFPVVIRSEMAPVPPSQGATALWRRKRAGSMLV